MHAFLGVYAAGGKQEITWHTGRPQGGEIWEGSPVLWGFVSKCWNHSWKKFCVSSTWKLPLWYKALCFQGNKVVRCLWSFASSIAMAVMAKGHHWDKICPEKERFSNYNYFLMVHVWFLSPSPPGRLTKYPRNLCWKAKFHNSTRYKKWWLQKSFLVCHIIYIYKIII